MAAERKIEVSLADLARQFGAVADSVLREKRQAAAQAVADKANRYENCLQRRIHDFLTKSLPQHMARAAEKGEKTVRVHVEHEGYYTIDGDHRGWTHFDNTARRRIIEMLRMQGIDAREEREAYQSFSNGDSYNYFLVVSFG